MKKIGSIIKFQKNVEDKLHIFLKIPLKSNNFSFGRLTNSFLFNDGKTNRIIVTDDNKKFDLEEDFDLENPIFNLTEKQKEILSKGKRILIKEK
jgi:hypothetical protein